MCSSTILCTTHTNAHTHIVSKQHIRNIYIQQSRRTLLIVVCHTRTHEQHNIRRMMMDGRTSGFSIALGIFLSLPPSLSHLTNVILCTVAEAEWKPNSPAPNPKSHSHTHPLTLHILSTFDGKKRMTSAAHSTQSNINK